MRYLLISLVSFAGRVLNLALWAYCILSWFGNSNPNLYKAYRFLGQYIDPFLDPIRRLMRPLTYKMGVDFSPFVLALLFSYVVRFVIRILVFVL